MGMKRKIGSYEHYSSFLYSACFFFINYEFHFVYWLNLCKTHCVLFASRFTARGRAMLYISLFTTFIFFIVVWEQVTMIAIPNTCMKLKKQLYSQCLVLLVH